MAARPISPPGSSSVLACVGALLGVWACTPAGPVGTAPPSPQQTVQSAAQPARPDLVPGSLLVELRPDAVLPTPPAPSTLEPTHAPAPTPESTLPTSGSAAIPPAAPVVFGGVPILPVRRIADRLATDGDSGDIYLVWLAAPNGTRLVDPSPAQTLSALQKVSRDPRVRRAEPDRIRYATVDGGTKVSDNFFPLQWNLQMIRAPEAWLTAQGSPDVVVAILDTGIVPGHPDLAGRLVPGFDFITNPDSADDGDTRRDPDPTDTGTVDSSRLHGTHVAGIIGAVTNNRLGIAGVDRACRLMPVRVLGIRNGDGIDSDIADAVRWAAGIPVGSLPRPARPADVLNLSFGGPVLSFTLQRAITQAVGNGALVVVAAGNGGDDARTYSPGGLDDVISVGAVGRSGQRTPYSNTGPRVDLLAPGGDADLTADDDGAISVDGVLSTYRDDGLRDDPKSSTPYTYGVLSGTSQSAPHVSAAAALSRALSPTLGQRAFAALVTASANPRYRCDSDPALGCGAGLLDVAALVGQVSRNLACGCTGDQVCSDGKSCAVPPPLHPPLIPDNTVHGGWCSLAPRGHAPSPHPLLCLLLACALAPARRSWVRHRRRAGSPLPPPDRRRPALEHS